MALINNIYPASRVLLDYFHHLLRGAHPWSLDRTSHEVRRNIAKMAKLKDWQVQLLGKLAPQIMNNCKNIV